MKHTLIEIGSGKASSPEDVPSACRRACDILLFLGAILLSISLGRPAGASTIIVDPGPVGTSGLVIQMPFDDLNSQRLLGQVFDLDFVFDDAKQVVVNRAHPSLAYNAVISIFSDTPYPGLPHLNSGCLIDLNGAPILNGGVTTLGSDVLGFYSVVSFVRSDLDGLPHHGVHLEDLRFPNKPGAVVIGAKLRLVASGSSSSLNVISEPSTSVLLILGVIAFLVCLSGRRRLVGP